MRKQLAEHIFFFAVFGLMAYVLWRIASPFLAPIALAAIIATIFYPIYTRIVRIMPRRNTSAAALASVLLVIVTLFVPVFVISYMLFLQALALYERLSSGVVFQVETSMVFLQSLQERYLPGFTLDFALYAREAAGWLSSHLGTVFAGTASTIFLLFIMFIGLFYMLRDGQAFLEKLIRVSPLGDAEDSKIIEKLAISVRSVVLGTLAVAFIQGTLTSIGFFLFGLGQPVLWGSAAALGALIPGVGTSVVFIGAVTYLVITESYAVAIGVALWGMFAVGLIDNLLGPYLMGRKAQLHPFLVLVSVLGGILFMGPIGFIIGPVALSFFMVLLELLGTHVKTSKKHAG